MTLYNQSGPARLGVLARGREASRQGVRGKPGGSPRRRRPLTIILILGLVLLSPICAADKPFIRACESTGSFCLTYLKWDKLDGDRIVGKFENFSKLPISYISITFTLKSREATTADAVASITSTIQPRDSWSFAAPPLVTNTQTFASYTDTVRITGTVNDKRFTETLYFERVWNPSSSRERGQWEKARRK